LWEVFLTEKADFSKLNILLLAITFKTNVVGLLSSMTVDRTNLMQNYFCEKQ